jgi:hypothetical protein
MTDPHLTQVRCLTGSVILSCLAILLALVCLDVRSDEGTGTYGFDEWSPALTLTADATAPSP